MDKKEYILENENVYEINKIKTDNQIVIEKILRSDMEYDKYTNTFRKAKIELTMEQKINNLKRKYILKIQEAQLLGDSEEAEKLQQEYLNKKKEIENE
ncbi:hypothetical protein P9597_26615 [Aneurinibacillus migulanus]|uniref:hypothetical protein n=1 Tax=Aneurinibacillus migulanus TaxID=47500 RepID=UPI002E1B0EC5|nr:hypothetical protein [Aneurinibacillus migulanus]